MPDRPRALRNTLNPVHRRGRRGRVFAAYRLRHYGPLVLVGFIGLAIYLTIVVGRRVLKREKL